jgi:hypothetical protein
MLHEQKYFECNCNTEGILVVKNDWGNPEDTDISFCIYTVNQYNPKPNIIQRLKYAWYHIRTGKKYEDQILLSLEKAQELGKYLIKISKNGRSTKM